MFVKGWFQGSQNITKVMSWLLGGPWLWEKKACEAYLEKQGWNLLWPVSVRQRQQKAAKGTSKSPGVSAASVGLKEVTFLKLKLEKTSHSPHISDALLGYGCGRGGTAHAKWRFSKGELW